MAGFIAMVSVMVVVGIEMFFATKGARHSHGGLDMEVLRDVGNSRDIAEDAHGRRSGSFKRFRQEPIGAQQESEDDVGDMSSMPRSPYSDSPGSIDKPLPPPPTEDSDRDEDDDLNLDLDELENEEDADDTTLLNGRPKYSKKRLGSSSPSNGRPNLASRNVSFAHPVSTAIPPSPTLPPAVQDQRLILQCLLLEAGILFHSVFIGMAVSVSTGPAFIVLLIAIAFHQTFEGLALGSRIAAIPSFSTTSLKPWFMSFLYGVTTPIGQAIGLAVHTLYDPASQFGLLMVGIVNAISAGLLLYAGLVQLLAEDFLSDASYVELQGRKRLEACAAVVAGSMLMAFVGACKSCNQSVKYPRETNDSAVA
jgi:solute carrier family 39 (zinc transporter), member 1/2/3